jgi:hypothetical protein
MAPAGDRQNRRARTVTEWTNEAAIRRWGATPRETLRAARRVG